MEILGIEIEGAYRIGALINRRGRRVGKKPHSKKHPIFRIRSKNLREFVWLYLQFRENHIRPSAVDLTILQEVVMKKLNVSQRKAYDFAKGMQMLD